MKQKLLWNRWALKFCTCILLMSGWGYAQELGKQELQSSPTSLLLGRLQVRLPKQAVLEPRASSIMGAADLVENETRVILDVGKERMVMMAYELFALAGKDMGKAVRSDMESSLGANASSFQIQKLEVASPLMGYLVAPKTQDTMLEANFVAGVYVTGTEGTVQYLAYYVNPEGAKDVPGALRLSKKISATLAAGPRALVLSAGERVFRGVKDPDRFSIRVPEGVVSNLQEGPDFSVFRLRQLATLGLTSTSCGIYQGGNPSYQYRQSQLSADKVKQEKGQLLGKEVDWQSWSMNSHLINEVMTTYPGRTDWFVHIFCDAMNPEALQAMRMMIATLQMESVKAKK